MNLLKDETLVEGWNCYDWRNAKAVLEHVHSNEWKKIISVVSKFKILHSALATKEKIKLKFQNSLIKSFIILDGRKLFSTQKFYYLEKKLERKQNFSTTNTTVRRIVSTVSREK